MEDASQQTLPQQFPPKDHQLHEPASSGERCFTVKERDFKISKSKSEFHLDAREEPKLSIAGRV